MEEKVIMTLRPFGDADPVAGSTAIVQNTRQTHH
jgi:hypothetical protein